MTPGNPESIGNYEQNENVPSTHDQLNALREQLEQREASVEAILTEVAAIEELVTDPSSYKNAEDAKQFETPNA